MYVIKNNEITNLENKRLVVRKEDKEIEIHAGDAKFIDNTRIGNNKWLLGPTYMEIYPTMNCNERCSFCYVGNSLSYEKKKMNKATVDVVSKQVGDIGIFNSAVLGGEPFMYDELEYLIKKLYDSGSEVSLSTNGTVHNFELMKRLTKFDTGFNVSFHSCNESLHNAIVKNSIAYKLTVETIKFLLETSSPEYVNISLVVNNTNFYNVLETMDFVRNLGIKSMSIYHAQGSGFAHNNNDSNVPFNKWVELIGKVKNKGKEIGLRVKPVTNYPFLVEDDLNFSPDPYLSRFMYGTNDGRRAVYVNYDGNIYATSYNFMDSRFCIGNITKDNLLDVWGNSGLLQAIRNNRHPEECEECKFFELCRGGPIKNYNLSEYLSEYTGKTPECPIHSQAYTE